MDDDRSGPPRLARRGILRATAGLVGGAAAFGASRRRAGAAEPSADLPPNIPQWMTEQGAPVLSPPYGAPSPFESEVVRRRRFRSPTLTAASSVTPLQDLHGIITPNGLFFERHHAGRPDIDPDQHRLMIHGLVERPLVLTMKDIMRFPSTSRIHFIECPANGGMEWRAAQVNSLQFNHGMISGAEWTGVKLSTLLEAAGVKDVLTKCLGSRNHFNVVYATLAGLKSLKSPEAISALRGKTVSLDRNFVEVATYAAA